MVVLPLRSGRFIPFAGTGCAPRSARGPAVARVDRESSCLRANVSACLGFRGSAAGPCETRETALVIHRLDNSSPPRQGRVPSVEPDLRAYFSKIECFASGAGAEAGERSRGGRSLSQPIWRRSATSTRRVRSRSLHVFPPSKRYNVRAGGGDAASKHVEKRWPVAPGRARDEETAWLRRTAAPRFHLVDPSPGPSWLGGRVPARLGLITPFT